MPNNPGIPLTKKQLENLKTRHSETLERVKQKKYFNKDVFIDGEIWIECQKIGLNPRTISNIISSGKATRLSLKKLDFIINK